MAKDGSSKKKTKPPREGPVGGKEKPLLKRKKMGSEIDEIFAAKKIKKPEIENKVTGDKLAKVSGNNAKSSDRTKIGRSSKSKVLKGDVFEDNASSSRPKKKTADGLAVYTEEELGIGKSDAGGTPLCPFDCNCCF